MLFATIGQAWVFLATVYGGLALGLLYDIARIVRIALGAGRMATMVVDALFWAVAGAVMFAAIWYAGAGDLRAYMLLGFACGWALFELALGRAVMAVFRLLRKLAAWLAKTRVGVKLFR